MAVGRILELQPTEQGWIQPRASSEGNTRAVRLEQVAPGLFHLPSCPEVWVDVWIVLYTWDVWSVQWSTLSSGPWLLSRSFILERNYLVSIHFIFTRYRVWWPGIKASVVRVMLQCKWSISAFTLKRESTVVKMQHSGKKKISLKFQVTMTNCTIFCFCSIYFSATWILLVMQG